MKEAVVLQIVPPAAVADRRPPRQAPEEQTLAIDGGVPVRREALPGPYPGALLIGPDEERQVLEVLRSKSLFRYYGPDVLGKVSEFERRFAARIGTRHALAVSSGTAALRCALFAAGVGEGDEVLVPAYSYIASADAVLSLGARPVFVEIDDTMTMDPEDLARKIDRPAVKAVNVVHLFGVPADLDRVMDIARPRGVRVIEDCAQACGATYRGRNVGSIGDLGIFSFQLNKVITAGEGGAVTTDDPALHDRAVRYHDHGNHRDDEDAGPTLIGEGMRLSELSGAVLLAQLGRLDTILAELRAAKHCLVERLQGTAHLRIAGSHDVEGDAGAALVFFLPTAELTVRVVAALQAEGIRAVRQYGGATLYQHRALRAAGIAGLPRCPASEDLASRGVYLALTSTFSHSDLSDIVTAVRKVIRGIARA